MKKDKELYHMIINQMVINKILKPIWEKARKEYHKKVNHSLNKWR